MNATVGKGKTVHISTDQGTDCGADLATGNRASVYLTDSPVTCKTCLRREGKRTTETFHKTFRDSVNSLREAVDYGPNARENFQALAKSAKTEAGKAFWYQKLQLL